MKTKKQVKKLVAKSKKIAPCVFTLSMGGEIFNSEGNTLDEAIKSLKIPKFTAKGIFTFTKGGKTSKPKYLFIPQMKQLFGEGMSSQTHRAVLIKRLFS